MKSNTRAARIAHATAVRTFCTMMESLYAVMRGRRASESDTGDEKAMIKSSSAKLYTLLKNVLCCGHVRDSTTGTTNDHERSLKQLNAAVASRSVEPFGGVILSVQQHKLLWDVASFCFLPV